MNVIVATAYRNSPLNLHLIEVTDRAGTVVLTLTTESALESVAIYRGDEVVRAPLGERDPLDLLSELVVDCLPLGRLREFAELVLRKQRMLTDKPFAIYRSDEIDAAKKVAVGV